MAEHAQPWDASLYQQKHAFVYQFGEDLIDLLDPKPGEQILDVGCGTGQLTARIAEKGANVIGIDLSESMIAQAKQNFPDLDFRVEDARAFYLANHFDAVFSNATLHWIKEPIEVIVSIWDNLKPGGRFVCELGGEDNIGAIQKAVLTALSEMDLKPKTTFDARHPWFFPSLGKYTTLLEAHQFEVRAAFYFERPTPLEGKDGLRNWLQMFHAALMAEVPVEAHEEFFERVETLAADTLWRPDGWIADYRRLRVVAHKKESHGQSDLSGQL